MKDVYASDPEGYLPRFVIADGKFVNYEILREGYARKDSQESVIPVTSYLNRGRRSPGGWSGFVAV